MTPDLAPNEALQLILKIVQAGFWTHPSFWIETIGLIFAAAAFWEARQAKVAATHAGRTVKIQTVALELTEASLKLDKLEPEIKFSAARDLLSETSRRITRAISPFSNEPQLKASIEALREAIEKASAALNSVRPTIPNAEEQAPHAVYYAIESHFSKINNNVAHLVGLLEKQTSNFGD